MIVSKSETVTIDQNIQEFALGCAGLAKEHDIREFTISIPSWWVGRENKNSVGISYTSIDSRGRPCEKLQLATTVDLIVKLKDDPESIS